VLSSDATTAACTALTNARQTRGVSTPWILGKLSAAGNAPPSAFNISVSSMDSSVIVFAPLGGPVTAPLQLKLVNVNTSTPGVTTLILTNADSSPWNRVWMLSNNSSASDDFAARWASFNGALSQNAFPDPVNSVVQGSSCNYPPGMSPPYINTDLQKYVGTSR
jgi:hypothetical protein